MLLSNHTLVHADGGTLDSREGPSVGSQGVDLKT